MKEHRIRCPCCGGYITVVVSDIDEVVNVFFNAKNTGMVHHYDFGNLKGGE